MKKTLLFLAALLITLSAFSAHYTGQIVTLNQPDGSPVEVRLYGDELFMRAESINGYTLVIDSETGFICYAKQSANDKNLISSKIKYLGLTGSKESESVEFALKEHGVVKELKHPKSQMQQIITANKEQLWENGIAPWQAQSGTDIANKTREISGTINQLAILIDFPDRPANIEKTEIQNAFNADDYNSSRSSIKTWAKTISNNMVTLNTTVIGYYRAPKPTSEYISDKYNFGELRTAAIKWADEQFDFSTLTTNNGIITSIMFLYSGNIVGTWGNSLWPHASSTNIQTNDGVRTGPYFLSQIGNNVPIKGINTFRHELGHSVFKWPDAYDYDGDSKSAGGFQMETDIPCGPFRSKNGWIEVIDIYGVNQSYHLPDDANTVLKYQNPEKPGEYFMIEYVRKTGWRSNAKDEGLLIWHVDEADGNNSWQDMTNERHYIHSVEQADGLFELEKNIRGGSDGDLYHENYRTLFNDNSLPDATWWDGSHSGLTVTNIGNKGDTAMSLTIETINYPVSGIYSITSAHSNKTIEVKDGGLANGTKIVQSAFTDQSSQKWNINRSSANYFTFKPLHTASSKYIHIPDCSPYNFTNLVLWDASSACRQYQLVDMGNNLYQVKIKDGSMCWDILNESENDGAHIVLNECSAANSQKWKLDAVTGSVGGMLLDNDIVQIENVGTGLLLRPETDLERTVVECINDTNNSDRTKWLVEDTGDGYFRFKSYTANARLRPLNGDNNVVMELGEKSWTGNWTQWKVTNIGGDKFTVKNRNSQKYFKPMASEPGSSAIQVPTDTDDNTKWKFQLVKRNDTPPTSINNVQTAENIHIYPTITNGVLNIELYSIENAGVYIYSLSGSLVWTQSMVNNKHQVINVSSLQQGLYLLKVITADRLYTARFYKN